MKEGGVDPTRGFSGVKKRNPEYVRSTLGVEWVGFSKRRKEWKRSFLSPRSSPFWQVPGLKSAPPGAGGGGGITPGDALFSQAVLC